MDSPFFATPIARQGPTSRLMRRRSEKVPAGQASNPAPAFTTSFLAPPERSVSFAVPVTPRNRNRNLEATMMTFNAGTDETLSWEATRLVDLWSEWYNLSCYKAQSDVNIASDDITYPKWKINCYESEAGGAPLLLWVW